MSSTFILKLSFFFCLSVLLSFCLYLFFCIISLVLPIIYILVFLLSFYLSFFSSLCLSTLVLPYSLSVSLTSCLSVFCSQTAKKLVESVCQLFIFLSLRSGKCFSLCEFTLRNTLTLTGRKKEKKIPFV